MSDNINDAQISNQLLISWSHLYVYVVLVSGPLLLWRISDGILTVDGWRLRYLKDRQNGVKMRFDAVITFTDVFRWRLRSSPTVSVIRQMQLRAYLTMLYWLSSDKNSNYGEANHIFHSNLNFVIFSQDFKMDPRKLPWVLTFPN